MTFGAPEELLLFWIEDEKRMQDATGHEFVSTARVLSFDSHFAIGDRAQFSALAESNIDESYIVKRIKFVENGRQTSRLYTAMMGRSR